MNRIVDYLLTLFTQFAGGPGPEENNLVRFGLPAVLWAVLLVFAWSRQRKHSQPREKLLVWGFGLGLVGESFMFSHVSFRLLEIGQRHGGFFSAEPFENALSLAAIVMVAGAYLRYILRDVTLSRRYLLIGLGTALICYLLVSWWWAAYLAVPGAHRFHQTVGGFVFQLAPAVFSLIAILILVRSKGWLRNIVTSALLLFFLSAALKLLNFPTQRAYDHILCPISNSFHILAIPLLGYVYLREQSIEKQQAEGELRAYKDQLEDLVASRTTQLTQANEQLQQEITVRKQAENAIARRNSELAAQNAIAATVSQSLDLDTILDTALDMMLAILDVDVGCIFLLEPDRDSLVLRVQRGDVASVDRIPWVLQACSCEGVAGQVVTEMKPAVLDVRDYTPDCRSPAIAEGGIQTLVGTPLVSKGRAVGAVSLGARRPDAIPPESLELLAGIGQQIGVVVDNANLHQETEHWAKELAMLHQMSTFLNSTLDPGEIYHHITEQSARLLGCQMACIFSWDEECQTAAGVTSYGVNAPPVDGLVLNRQSPILSELASERHSIPIDDARVDQRIPPSWIELFDMQSVLCVPVWGGEKPLAALFLVEQRQRRYWRTDEVALVESFVNGAAVSLENAYLHKQLEWAATLEERQRIAAEIHDGLAQTLSYLGLKVDSTIDLSQSGRIPDITGEWQHIRDIVDRLMLEARRSIASLQQTPPPRQPLQECLSELVTEFNRNGGPAVALIDDVQSPLFLSHKQIEQVLRVAREGMLNASRHAQAGHITLHLQEMMDTIVVTVEDDGCGFDVSAPRAGRGDHFGLSIMRARAARIGGQIEIDSTPGRGTRVILSWPLHGTEPKPVWNRA